MDTVVVGIQDVCKSGAALGFAIKEAALRGARLRIIQSCDIALRPEYIHSEVSTGYALEALEREAGRSIALALECAARVEPSVRAEGKAVFGDAADTLLDEAKAALVESGAVLLIVDDCLPGDLRGRSTIRQLLRHSPCPLTIVPARAPKGRRRHRRCPRSHAEEPASVPSRDRTDAGYRQGEKDYALLSLADIAVLGKVDRAAVERRARENANFPKPVELHQTCNLYDRRSVYKWAIEAGLKGLDLAP